MDKLKKYWIVPLALNHYIRPGIAHELEEQHNLKIIVASHLGSAEMIKNLDEALIEKDPPKLTIKPEFQHLLENEPAPKPATKPKPKAAKKAKPGP